MSGEADLFEFTDPTTLPHAPLRVVLHWTAGTYRSTPHDRAHYHGLVEWHEPGWTPVVRGAPIRNNMRSLVVGDPTFSESAEGYAPHTRGFNSFSIGFALCGMLGARRLSESVYEFGEFPIKPEQVDTLVALTANACAVYDLEPDEEHVFTHAEAESIHGVDQHGKWDILALPFEPGLGPDEVGPWLRERVAERLSD